MNSKPSKTRKLIWINIIFFAITTLGAVIGLPIHVYHFGVSTSEIVLFLFFVSATGLSVTVGYHRLFSHVTFKAHPMVQFLTLFFGAAAFEQSALRWSSQHRDHHRYVDTEWDPYSIKRGFFYAHIGWLIFWKHKINYDNVKDLQKNKLVMNQFRYYHLWALVTGILTPLLLGAFLWSVCARLTIVYHGTFCINSVCHMFGKATYDIYATARDYWLVALITYGEGYHNYHHRFPGDYRNGVLWYQWDPSKWTIALLACIGLVWDLKRVSNFRILEARLAGENQRVTDCLKLNENYPVLNPVLDALRLRYENVKQNLGGWEGAARECRNNLQEHVARRSKEFRKRTLTKLKKARSQFKKAHQQWTSLINLKPLDLEQFLLANPLG